MLVRLSVNRLPKFCTPNHTAITRALTSQGYRMTKAVPDIRLRLRCSKCGARPMQTRPDWTQYTPKGRNK
jgi:hypothetical protein